MADVERDKKWTHERKQVLLTVRLQYESEFAGKKKKKIVLWEKVLQELKTIDPEFPFTRDEIIRKFLNMSVTYKRIKKRNATSGEASTSWEYFDAMDEVYGTRSDVCVPISLLDSSLENLEAILSGSSDTAPTPSSSRIPPEPPRKRSRCEVLDYLRDEGNSDKELLKEFLKCEQEKLKVEKEKVEEIKKLREMLSCAVNQNSA